MKFAILAAGEGSRLAQEGITVPKPLVELNGEAMIDRLIRIFHENNAEKIVIITNNLTPYTAKHLSDLQKKDPLLEVLVKTTPSSMHSFYELKSLIGSGKFCLTTVDTIFREQEFKRYINEFQDFDGDGMMAVTDYIDDEKPLYISVNDDMGITGFHDDLKCEFISGGIYCLNEKSFVTLDNCIKSGMSRMRNFQRQLIADGLRLKAYKFSKILDVDHQGDIIKAENFLGE